MFFRCCIIFFLALHAFAAHAADNDYLLQLKQQAQTRNLAQHPEWLNLLHYKPYAFLSGSRSLADDPKFFNSPDGAKNSGAELDATLTAFFSSVEETDKLQNPQCAFIARYQWLKHALQFDASKLPEQACKRFHDWYTSLNPHEVTLIFPAAYLNNPSSMYGHTLLRIDGKDQDEQTRLLAYAINYAANTDEPQGFLYAYKGLTGGYPGMFSSMPYYLKVREYNDFENRDIWEYRLNLKPEEIERMLMHVWELGPIYFNYFFIDENCSYHLLSLLEVARPGLQLTDRFRWAAIPSDTVRAVAEQAGLLKEAVYRPSTAASIRSRMEKLSATEQATAKKLAQGSVQAHDAEIIQLAPTQRAAVLELGMEYQAYLRAGKVETPQSAAQTRSLLIARSKLDVPNHDPIIPVPSVRPDRGHKTSRMDVGFGVSDGAHFQELVWRPSYHELIDPEAGYNRGAQIQFLRFALRRYDDERKTRLEKIIPIDILSLAPRDDFFQRLSWKINLSGIRTRVANGEERPLARLNGGAGYAWEIGKAIQAPTLLYSFLDATLDAGKLPGADYALGAGPALGMVTDLSPDWRVHTYARVQRFALGNKRTAAEISLDQRFTLGPNAGVRLSLGKKKEFDRLWNHADINFQYYY
jgi:Domain of unknown function (DUF4105)